MIAIPFTAAIGRFGHRKAEDEQELMRRVKAREVDALEELYELYKSLLFGLVLSILKNREEAEDLLQEIFIAAWQKAGSFDENRDNLYSWMTTLARNKAIARIRAGTAPGEIAAWPEETGTPLDSILQGHDPLQTTIYEDRAALIKSALRQIPDEQRIAVEAAFCRGLTYSEVSEYLDLPLNTVKANIRQGMISIKNILTKSIQAGDG